MQQNGPQFAQSSAPAHPFGQPYAQPLAAPQQLFPTGQPFAQPLPQPYPQSYGQPMPGAQPVAQSYPPPVPAPSGALPVTQSQPLSPQQSAQQAHVRQAVGIARNLEQIIPGYQLAISLVEELIQHPKEPAAASATALRGTLQDAAFYHFASLGALRRFLCGESTPEVITALAAAINHLSQVHMRLRSQAEQLLVSAPPEMRSGVANFTQAFGTAESQLHQAVSAVQANVSPQVWEAARAKALAAERTARQPEASG